MATEYDAILIVGFGGPERREDVVPFLENVTRGRNIPRERLLTVAEHYHHFGGKSPLNDQVRDLIAALRPALKERGIDLPIAWGNRNWHPFLVDALQQLSAAGARRVLALVLAAYSSYSSCRQYREDIERAREACGPEAPRIDKIRVFFNHPGFVAANADRLREALAKIPAERRSRAHMAFTAHSIPLSMAQTSRYADQLNETCRLVCERLGIPADHWALVYQSRSGRPSDPWLGPDISDHLAALSAANVTDVALLPVGFLSDHLEVLYDLDIEAQQKSHELGVNLVRAATVGTHPQFVDALADLVEERVNELPSRSAIGTFEAWPDLCPDDCCPAPRRA
ncbi:MAG TPA: ferrochelatase [Planctomycetaceae bacterium]|nr:ferrochelatase [Planctomycetaceae bacterium]